MRPSGRRHHISQHLLGLTTKSGEKCGLKEAISRILYLFTRRCPFILACGFPQAHAAYPKTSPTVVGTGTDDPKSPYLALLRMGFSVPLPSPVRRCALTAPFHPFPGSEPRVVYSLLHFPSRCHGRPLTGMLPVRSPDFPPLDMSSEHPPPSARLHSTSRSRAAPFHR